MPKPAVAFFPSEAFSAFVAKFLSESLLNEAFGGEVQQITNYLQDAAIASTSQQRDEANLWTVRTSIKAASSIHTLVQFAVALAKREGRRAITVMDIVKAQNETQYTIWPFATQGGSVTLAPQSAGRKVPPAKHEAALTAPDAIVKPRAS